MIIKKPVTKPKPPKCDACGGSIGTVFYDARLEGRWGNYCHYCFYAYGGKLGVGNGQKYKKQVDGIYLKVGG